MKRILAILCVAFLLMPIASSALAADGQIDPSLANASEIKLGVAITLTGPQSSVGRESERGIELAVKEINDAGGILGKKFQVIKYDEKGDPQESLKVVTRLIEQDQVNVIFGPLSSNSMMAVGEYVNNAKTVTMGPAVGVVWTNQGWDYVFRCTSNTYMQCVQAADLIEKQGYKKIAIFNINEEYGNNSRKDIIALLEKKNIGIQIVANEVYKNGDTDFTSQSVRIANSGADCVFLVGWANDCGSLLKQIRRSGFEGPIVGDNSLPGLPVREVAGSASDDVYCTAAYILPDTVAEIDTNPSFTSPMINKFLHAYYKEFKELPTNDNCYRSYDGIYIIAEAIKNAKSIKSADIQKALSNIDNFDRIAGVFSYVGNHGEGIYTVNVYRFVDGKVELFTY